jgi:hypothetical protein
MCTIILAIKEKNYLQQKHEHILSTNLNLAIRNLLLSEITQDVIKEAPILQDLTEHLKKEINIFQIKKREVFSKVVGVDAGNQMIPLASRRYSVISALAYRLPNGERFFLSPESIIQSYNDEKGLSVIDLKREAKLFETALKFLEYYPDTELVLIDGPLFFSNWWKKAGKKEDHQRLISSVNNLLLHCRENKILIAGIVKRPSARYLLDYIGLNQEIDFNDVYILQNILKKGERTDVFNPKNSLSLNRRNYNFMDNIDFSIYSFYARMSFEWNLPPIRIDLPISSLCCLDEIAEYCYATSFWNGIPLCIIRADEEVAISRKFVVDVYSEILSRISRENGEISQIAPYWGESKWMGV